ncbi:peroxisomal membrane protein 4 isoform X4 [Camelus dromedarius]|uniref:peroxisomal membrane protein 4 isoform X4 n=1 Tax=Camelus dromedarius TaxID=9838 RepID=UPI00311A2792
MAAPPQLQTLLLAVNALLRKRRYHAVLAMLKGFRNGAVYGAKIRAPHALVMTFLFRSGRVVKEDLLEKVAWNQGLNQPPGEAARHPTGHVHPLPEPGQLCVHLQGTLRPAVPPAGGDLPGALIPGCLHWGLAGIWKQQYHQQPDQHVPDVTHPVCPVPPGHGEGLHPRAQVLLTGGTQQNRAEEPWV